MLHSAPAAWGAGLETVGAACFAPAQHLQSKSDFRLVCTPFLNNVCCVHCLLFRLLVKQKGNFCTYFVPKAMEVFSPCSYWDSVMSLTV